MDKVSPEILEAVRELDEKYPHLWGPARMFAEVEALGYQTTEQEVAAARQQIQRGDSSR